MSAWGNIDYQYTEGEVRLLDYGYCLGRKYLITYCTDHPNAYICSDNTLRDPGIKNFPVHGGITWPENSGKVLKRYLSKKDAALTGSNFFSGNWVGWDYAHSYDYLAPRDTAKPLEEGKHKYSFEEIRQDIYRAASFLGPLREEN